ncbi:uncharacterized protein LAESUDRAFT_137183 [Laetiporus sulphureus 93-53]|uniref:MYND-type domain-containing protein n=1 Tax=Laetiporus sulphureus 93-53 TaxID=1314785 RepID=A0A165ED99_9APHY|nr:uncharacterized protein LAESUDRAFT_137183 [Laetiporus sulphureus 93-53]KZT06786.1 hypothetical protein LAESUDRAFT_137183 [Laetiporus sulphureus 93-53]
MTALTIPDDFVVDLHDLAAIILDCHARTEDRFTDTQLVEVNNGNRPLETLPDHILPPEWHILFENQRRVAYILRKNPQLSTPVTLNNFAHPEQCVLPGSPRGKQRRELLETAYWRCKDFDAGYLLTYVAQRVFERLPPTARLRARTATGYEMTCAPDEVLIAEVEVLPHTACVMAVYEPRPELGLASIGMEQHLSGFDGPIPWVYLAIGVPQSTYLTRDTRVFLDLALPQIGGRGSGHEPFALERGFDYHNRVLHKFADEYGEVVLSSKLRLSLAPPAYRTRGDMLIDMVVERLAKIAAGQDNFCRYCGKDGINTQCSVCKEAYFCADCRVPGWKYHKVWCVPVAK